MAEASQKAAACEASGGDLVLWQGFTTLLPATAPDSQLDRVVFDGIPNDLKGMARRALAQRVIMRHNSAASSIQTSYRLFKASIAEEDPMRALLRLQGSSNKLAFVAKVRILTHRSWVVSS